MVVIVGKIGNRYFLDDPDFEMRINGEIIVPPRRRLQIPKPFKIERVIQTRVVEGYTSYRGEKIGVETYDKMLADADSEWAKDAIREAWRALYRIDVEYRDVDFTIVDYEDKSPVKYIKALGKVGKENYEPLYTYKPNYEKMIREVALESGFREGDGGFNAPHRYYHFSSWGDSIRTWRKDYRVKFTKGLSVGTLEECLKRYEEDMEIIKHVFQDTEEKIRLFDKEIKNVGLLVVELENIMTDLRKIKTKTKKSEEERVGVIIRLGKIIDRLKYLDKKEQSPEA